ncbi:MAG: DUF3592 domain-containing protein [Planctomycetota bacterium]|nr:DUF3592 domain-containing protein [Planctomycetota bacterium]
MTLTIFRFWIFIAYAFTAVFGIMALAFLYWGINKIDLGRKSEHWPTTTGLVTRSEVVETVSNDKYGVQRSYVPIVEYEFVVNGVTQKGDVISYRVDGYSKQDADAVVAQHPIATPTTVHYDADDPTSAVLKSGVDGGFGFVLGIGGILLVGAFIMFVFLRKMVKKTESRLTELFAKSFTNA